MSEKTVGSIRFGGGDRVPIDYCYDDYPADVCREADTLKRLLVEKFMHGRQKHGNDLARKSALELAYETREELLDALWYTQKQITKMEDENNGVKVGCTD